MNRFYLFIFLFFIHLIGFSQCNIIIDYSSSSTYQCYTEGENAAAYVIANVGALPISEIEFDVIEGGTFDVTATQDDEALIKFYDPGNYVIELSHNIDNQCYDTVHFTVNDPVEAIEFTSLQDHVFENKKKKVMMPISNPLCTTFWHEEVIRANV